MNNNPNDYDRDVENRQDLMPDQEAFLLQQEEQRLKAAKRQAKFGWIRNTILLLVGALQILLGMRFFLRLAGANTENQFAQFIYNLSDPFIAPFSTLFISPVRGGGNFIFDVNVLIAMFVYSLLGWLGIAVVNYFQGQAPYRR